ncbi:hypothetical protein A0U89_13935 (plasmid) [Kozakia baliensis]|uniref:Uncharacterized protein n=1 Tax=Kozakia baliensis TaxID=153496 RepID=A0A1D8UXN4_9PROT|nr:hypothetical protein A0U89_13935 [Kozakia baliensis]
MTSSQSNVPQKGRTARSDQNIPAMADVVLTGLLTKLAWIAWKERASRTEEVANIKNSGRGFTFSRHLQFQQRKDYVKAITPQCHVFVSTWRSIFRHAEIRHGKQLTVSRRKFRVL